MADPGEGTRARLRGLPQVERLLRDAAAAGLVDAHGRAPVLAALRDGLERERRRILDGECRPFETAAFLHGVRARLDAEGGQGLRRVINATGVVLHTNLGRAPLAEAAVAAVAEAARGYSNLEFDLGTGGRGSRYQAVERLLCTLTGAEAALVVNNNAAAVLLALSELAGGGEALVSRGELVEIGGSFRIPEVVRQGGATLVEIGATNKTRLSDYRDAVTEATRVVLKVHQSNFRIVGFTAAPDLAELVALAHEHGLPVLEDLGSGTIADLSALGLPHEPTVRESIAAGVDLVTFSGDKLLGGPQAGIVAGRGDLVARLKRHPLLRALRIDKMSLAALEATLRLYLDPAQARQALPVLRMMTQDRAALAARAQRLAGMLSDAGWDDVAAADGTARIGGGSLPGVEVPSVLVTVGGPPGAEALAARLRAARPAVIGRIVAGRFALDMLTVGDGDLDDVAAAFREAGR